ncbi:ferritin-like domain-containing protein [Kitasatospora cathayae]|uniref:Ferritin-like domain-containing protein n=1 Tax=Kitasatospora cathayae TaxID=3004092 RepID=A0ABY7Q4D3_9ACTN|nr:ferritin-like domain-containing protein [Kitasatospora sp. HUAS 3-15]WBP87518.1 ferritin-like domain-containing protein [Kitasatospora sp. HUAS 3-15]
MLSTRSLFNEIYRNDQAYQLFCSIAAGGEDQGGWENERITALTRDPVLAPKIARHGADERKHGRIFTQLLNKRGLPKVPVPDEADYCMLLERQGVGLSHERLRSDAPLTDREIITYLAHSRVTEQRAAEQMRQLVRVYGDNPELCRAMRMISADEDDHLAYCHEELLRLTAEGHGPYIRHALEASARGEIRTHRDVGLAVSARMARILRWPRWQLAVINLGVHALYLYDLAFGWRRMVSLRMPERRNALGTPAPPHAEHEVP